MAGISFDDLPMEAAKSPMQGSPPISFDDLPSVAPPRGTGEDIAKGFGTGLYHGVTGLAGFMGDAQNLAGGAINYAVGNGIDALGINPDTQYGGTFAESLAKAKALSALNPLNRIMRPTSDQIEKQVSGATGFAPQDAQTVPGQYAETIGKFLPGAALNGGGLAGALRMGVAPAIASEAAGQATEGTDAEPWARLAGAVLAPGAASIGRAMVTPNTLTPARQALVDALKNEGVQLTAGQITGNKAVRWAESALGDMPGSGGKPAAIDEAQRGQFTQAALRRIGSDAPLATPDALAAAKADIGQQFDDLSARNNLKFDPQMGGDLNTALSKYDLLLPSQQKEAINNYVADIASKPGGMTGAEYQASRSRLSAQSNAVQNSDPALSGALGGIRDALDGAMERSIQPGDAGAWADARNKWANWKVIEQAATGAGENSAQGYISPSQLRNAVVNQNRGAYATGNGDFADLARAGEAIMKPLPNSGTAPRQYMQHLASALGGAAGYGAAGGAGALAGAMAPGVLGRALMSRPIQSYLGNQLLPRNPGNNGGLAQQLLLLGRSANAFSFNPIK